MSLSPYSWLAFIFEDSRSTVSELFYPTGEHYEASTLVLNRWRKEFTTSTADVFTDKRDHGARACAQGYQPGQSPDEFKRVIGGLTVQGDRLYSCTNNLAFISMSMYTNC